MQEFVRDFGESSNVRDCNALTWVRIRFCIASEV
jgi:hypothetical protein